MSPILWRYLVREVTVPTLLALVTVTFVLLIGIVSDMIELLLQPAVDGGQVLRALAMFVPALMVFGAPLAVLVGIIIGVGRLMLDREVLAIQAAGANILAIFTPVLLLGVAVSGVLFWLSGGAVPLMQQRGIREVAQLQLSLVNSLEPGMIHDRLGGDDSGFVLFFESRDPETGRMRGITLQSDEEVLLSSAQRDSMRQRERAIRRIDAEARAAEEPLPPRPLKPYRETEQTLIFAREGEIASDVRQGESDEDGDLRVEARLVLRLVDGSIHRYMPGDETEDYVAINFLDLERSLFEGSELSGDSGTRTNRNLRDVMSANDPEENSYRRAKMELVERYSMAWASFVFALVGVPLAIWVKPTGKSWGIVMAILVMLVYYVWTRTGVAMIESGHPAGVFATFSPNLAFALLGIGLWWRALTR